MKGYRGGAVLDRVDRLAGEEPLEIRVGGLNQEPSPLVVTMRTPGDDFELAAGFLHTEGLVATAGEIETIAYCVGPGGAQEYNIVTVNLRREWDPGLRRSFLSNASCGICGKSSIEEVEVLCASVSAGPVVAPDVLISLPARMDSAQRVFAETGGLHASALFDRAGSLLTAREDVGRHNALDKVIGHHFLAGAVPLNDTILLVSGRVSFEIVQKAAVAGIPFVAAVSAPSSLAVDAARQFGMTLVGFLRGADFNVYTGSERLDGAGG